MLLSGLGHFNSIVLELENYLVWDTRSSNHLFKVDVAT